LSAERVIANLLRIAREDLEGARMLNARGNRNAIYLWEQAAEKIIRAVLTSEKVHAGVRHQLDEMVGLVPDENPIKPRLRSLQHLSTARRRRESSRVVAIRGRELSVLGVDARADHGLEQLRYHLARTMAPMTATTARGGAA
jgi:HEPN domain-containing protein